MSATVDFDAVVRACAARDTRLEGIEMIVVLDDLVGEPPAGDPSADGERLLSLERAYLASRGSDEAALDDEAVQRAAEIAAVCDFGDVT